MKVYLDNASTTKLDDRVLESMNRIKDIYGNPSSIHKYGRIAKCIIEKSRKKIAEILNIEPSEVFFTSSGSEGNNMAINGIIETFKIKNIITSPIEHHTVLNPIKNILKKKKINLHFLKIHQNGNINYNNLEKLLKKYNKSMVNIMHINNEIGNINKIELIGDMCRKYKCIFHSDGVQSLGYYKYNFKELNIDFLTGSAHKFHGPKGIGIIYINKNKKINPLIYGGLQERNIRSGTENISGIVGISKALEISYKNINKNREYIKKLKYKMIKDLKKFIPNIKFNGNALDSKNNSYKLLNINFSTIIDIKSFLFNLDILNIFASGGSACASGINKNSHVLSVLKKKTGKRISFSKYNTKKEINYATKSIIKLCKKKNT